MYYLVEFKDQAVEVVPECWLEKEAAQGQRVTVAFPQNTDNVRKMVVNKEMPHTTWPAHEVKVLYLNGNYLFKSLFKKLTFYIYGFISDFLF
jgi:hypothetical protein